MKKWVKIICAVVVLVAVAAGAFFMGRSSVQLEEPSFSGSVYAPTFYAAITQKGDSWLLVEGLEVNDINHRSAFTLGICEDTELVWHYTDIEFDDLAVGQTVAVTYTGPVLESYPAQITNTLRIEVLDDDLHIAVTAEERIVTDIVDRTETEHLVTSDVLDGFWKDEQYCYYFSSNKSQYIIVHYSDGTQEPVREAMEAGRVTLADLDRIGIGYYKEEIVTAVGMECKEGMLDAPIIFWSDEKYDYWFPTTGTEVTVFLSDGHRWPLHDALMAGLVTVSDLDDYGIKYYKEPKE